ATVYLVAAGRANHGGKGIRPGIDTSCADMNAHLIGIEVGNNGVGEPWPDHQTSAYGAVVAALVDHYDWTFYDVYLHATTGTPAGAPRMIDKLPKYKTGEPIEDNYPLAPGL